MPNDSPARDRPAREIEVTPEMVAAGVDELYNHDITEPERVEMCEAVRCVFLAKYGALAGTRFGDLRRE